LAPRGRLGVVGLHTRVDISVRQETQMLVHFVIEFDV
jgi:hypothetical protein